MADILNTDGISVTEDEATEMCVYHLRMARVFFELVPDDGNVAIQEEIDRVITKRDGPEHGKMAAYWAAKAAEYYESLKAFD